MPVVFPLRIGGVFHVKSCVSAAIDFVLLHIPYVVDNKWYRSFGCCRVHDDVDEVRSSAAELRHAVLAMASQDAGNSGADS
jgi:hypothetical protein